MSANNKSGNKNLQDKKSKVTEKSARLSPTTIIIAGLLMVMVGVGVYLTVGRTGEGAGIAGPGAATTGAIERASVGDPVDYTQTRVDMTNIDYEVEGDVVKIALDDVIKNKLSRFEFKSDKINETLRNFAGTPALPVMALIDPNGKLMVGVSYCEPCRSTTFHTETDNTLTCNKCGTKWDIATLSPISGSPACMSFPPDELKVEVKDGQVLIPKGDLENWVPRGDT